MSVKPPVEIGMRMRDAPLAPFEPLFGREEAFKLSSEKEEAIDWRFMCLASDFTALMAHVADGRKLNK